MAALQSLETKLDEMLVKKAPFQIPENGRKWIADYAWIFALVGVILGVLAFFPLLAVVGIVSTFGVAVGAGFAVLMAWLSLAMLGAYIVVLGIATPKLKNKQPMGWNLCYYSTLFFAVYDVINWVRYPAGIFNLLLNLIGTLAGLYVLFQVRSYFKGGTKAAAKK
jgi:hypothetical protein